MTREQAYLLQDAVMKCRSTTRAYMRATDAELVAASKADEEAVTRVLTLISEATE